MVSSSEICGSRGRSEHGRAAPGDEKEDQCVFPRSLQHAQRGAGRGKGVFVGNRGGRLQNSESANRVFLGNWLEQQMPRMPLRRFTRSSSTSSMGPAALPKAMTKIFPETWTDRSCRVHCRRAQDDRACCPHANAAVEGRGNVTDSMAPVKISVAVACRVSREESVTVVIAVAPSANRRAPSESDRVDRQKVIVADAGRP